jgi:uncharacterized protein (DUF1697 family)
MVEGTYDTICRENQTLDFCFDAFSLREPVSTPDQVRGRLSLENATGRCELTVFVAMLRGVNVGGNSLKMDWLRAACADAGLQNVRTYVQSGNIVFSSPASAPKLAHTLKALIDAQTRLPVSVIIRSAPEMAKIVAGNPFLKQKSLDISKLHVTFLSEAPSKPAPEKLDALAGSRDGYRLLKQEIYLHCPINYGQTKLSNTAIEKVLSVGATTRNWKTVTVLCEMAAG